jgi:PadR family transcriptional regulator PadR
LRIETELMRGAGPTAVLQLLAAREMYGYELADALDRRSHGVLAMGHSTLYPLLYNLEAKGLITARWEDAESGRRRKYYRLTRKGEKRLVRQREQWRVLVEALARLDVLEEQPGGA